MRWLWWVVLGIVAVVLILFAVSNRQHVLVSLWPLPTLVELPLYLVLLATLLVGFVAGELTGWIGGWRWRWEARRGRERIAMLEREIEAERSQRAASRAPLVAIPP